MRQLLSIANTTVILAFSQLVQFVSRAWGVAPGYGEGKAFGQAGLKTHVTFSLAACLTFASSEIAAQEKKGETLHGVIEAVDGNTITVTYRRKSRTFTIHEKAKINYVSFLKAKREKQTGILPSRRRRF